MLSMSSRATCVRHASSLFCLLLLLVLLTTTSHAQVGAIDSDPTQAIGTRATARNTVQGNIYLPSGQRVDRRLRVRITGATGGDLTTMCDENGSFIFSRLAGGTYFITVNAGKEFEPVSETVDILDPGVRGSRGQVITIQIQLQLKRQSEGKPAVINAALAGVPKPALDLYKKALEAAQAGDGKKAIEHLKGALALHPEFALAHNELGVQYLRLGELEKAAAALRSALKIAPEAFTPRLNYGIVLVQKKQFAEAEAELRRALEKNNASATANLYRGRALIGLGNYDEAEKALRRALSLGGNEVSLAHRYLGALYIERGENARAISELEIYLSLAPTAKDAGQIREIIKQLQSQVSQK